MPSGIANGTSVLVAGPQVLPEGGLSLTKSRVGDSSTGLLARTRLPTAAWRRGFGLGALILAVARIAFTVAISVRARAGLSCLSGRCFPETTSSLGIRQACTSKGFIYFAEKNFPCERFFEKDAILNKFVALVVVFWVAGHKDYFHFREKIAESRS